MRRGKVNQNDECLYGGSRWGLYTPADADVVGDLITT
jgi:hypothetical protein